MNPNTELGLLLAGDPFCKTHGWMSHVFLHEAAHTVAAIERGIDFTHVEVPVPAMWEANHSGELMLGGVNLVAPPSWTTSADANAGLEMALAGIVAEKGGWGHWLDGGYIGDMRMWARGAGVAGDSISAIQEELERVLGCSLADVMRRTETWVVEAYPRIANVSNALAGRTSNDTPGRMDYANGPWRLSADEAKAAAAS